MSSASQRMKSCPCNTARSAFLAISAVTVALLNTASALHIVQVLPLTGENARIGEYYLQGYGMYFDEIGNKVSWGSSQITLSSSNLVLLDSESRASIGAARLDTELTTLLVSDPDVFILGGYDTAEVAALIEIANKHQVPYINAGSATAGIYKTSSANPGEGKNDGRWAFGLLSSVKRMADSILNLMQSLMDEGHLQKPCNIALLWENSSEGEAFRQEIASYALRKPNYFQIYYASDFPYPLDDSDPDILQHLETDLERVWNKTSDHQDNTCHALLVDAHSNEFRVFLDTLASTAMTFDFASFGARGVEIEDVNALDHPEYVNGLIAAQWWSITQNSKVSRDWAQRWRLYEAYAWADSLQVIDDAIATTLASSGTSASSTAMFSMPSEQLDAEWYAALAYESARVLIESMQSASATTRKSVRSYMQATTFTDRILPGGSLSFDENGQAEYEMTLVQAHVEYEDNDGTHTHSEETDMTLHNLYPLDEKTGSFVNYTNFGQDLTTCTIDDFVQGWAHECDGDWRRVTFYWSDREGRACMDPDIPCGCDNSVVQLELPTTSRLECPYVPYNSITGKVIISLTSIGGIVCYVFLFVVLRHYSNVAIKAGQREFLVVMCFAGIWCNIAAMSFLGPNRTNKCRTRVIHLALSITLLVGALTVKVYRIWRIWNNSTMKRISVTAQYMFKVLALIMFGMVLIITIWYAVDAPKAVEAAFVGNDKHLYQIPGYSVDFSANICVYFGAGDILRAAEASGVVEIHNGYVVFPVFAVSYVIVILLFTTFLSYQGRDSDAKYMESRSIMFASYVATSIIVLTMILVAGVPMEIKSQTFLVSATLVFTSLILIMLVIGPKIYYVTVPELQSVSRVVKQKLGSGSRQTSNPEPTSTARKTGGTRTNEASNLTSDNHMLTRNTRTMANPTTRNGTSQSRVVTFDDEDDLEDEIVADDAAEVSIEDVESTPAPLTKNISMDLA